MALLWAFIAPEFQLWSRSGSAFWLWYGSRSGSCFSHWFWSESCLPGGPQHCFKTFLKSEMIYGIEKLFVPFCDREGQPRTPADQLGNRNRWRRRGSVWRQHRHRVRLSSSPCILMRSLKTIVGHAVLRARLIICHSNHYLSCVYPVPFCMFPVAHSFL